MSQADLAYICMVMVVPGLLGVMLITDGARKVVRYNPAGWITISVGMTFMLIIAAAYFYMSGFLGD